MPYCLSFYQSVRFFFCKIYIFKIYIICVCKQWKAGDFIISDNLALGHEAHPSTQYSRDKVGLRVMHRTTIKGILPPAKMYKNDELWPKLTVIRRLSILLISNTVGYVYIFVILLFIWYTGISKFTNLFPKDFCSFEPPYVNFVFAGIFDNTLGIFMLCSGFYFKTSQFSSKHLSSWKWQINWELFA